MFRIPIIACLFTIFLLASDGVGSDRGQPPTQPTCDASQRGRLWMTNAGAGVADKLEACQKKSDATYAWKDVLAASSGGPPSGSILLIDTGTCPAGYTEVAGLAAKTLVGTLAASLDVGTTGGADNITPAGTNSAPTFTGNLATLSHAGTAVDAHSGTAVANHVFTQPTIAWPVGVPTNSGGAVDAHSGTAVANHASHTHTYTDVINHTHVVNVTDPGHTHTQKEPTGQTGGQDGGTRDTSTNGSSNIGYGTASSTTGITASSDAPVGGVATGTTAGPSATLTHSVTQPNAHVFTQPTIAWPVGVPTNSGGAVDAHSVTQPNNHVVTQPNDHSYTPTGSVAAPVFTGTSFDNRSAFMKVIFCKKD